MMYYVVEIQKLSGGGYAHLVHTASTQEEGESKLYQVLAAAAISGLPVHTGVLIREDGVFISGSCYKHEDN